MRRETCRRTRFFEEIKGVVEEQTNRVHKLMRHVASELAAAEKNNPLMKLVINLINATIELDPTTSSGLSPLAEAYTANAMDAIIMELTTTLRERDRYGLPVGGIQRRPWSGNCRESYVRPYYEVLGKRRLIRQSGQAVSGGGSRSRMAKAVIMHEIPQTRGEGATEPDHDGRSPITDVNKRRSGWRRIDTLGWRLRSKWLGSIGRPTLFLRRSACR